MPLNLRLGSSWSTHSILKRKEKSNHNKTNHEDDPNYKNHQPIKIKESESDSIPSLHIANHHHHQPINLHQHHHHLPSPSLPNRPISDHHHHQHQSNSHLIHSSSNSSLPSLQPFSPEFTIAILHLGNISSAIKTTIESRLTSTGFKFTSQLTINLSEDHHLIDDLTPLAKSGFQNGLNLIYLLSRARAIQVWKDLVGQSNLIHTSNHPSSSFDSTPLSRPGSLSSMFGKDVIWAAENVEVVYELICKFWSKEDYKFNSQFAQLSSRSQSQQSIPHSNSFHPSPTLNPNLHLFSSPLQLSSSENGLEDPASKPKKRVFKFSHRVSNGPPDLLSKAVQSGPILPTLAREGRSSTNLQDAFPNHQALGVKILTEANEHLIKSEEQPDDWEESEDKQPTPSNSPHRQSLLVTTPRSISTHTSFDTLSNALESPSPTQSTQPTQPSSPPPSTLFRISRTTSQTSESLHSPCSLSSTANSIHSTEHSSTPNLLRTTAPTITTTNTTQPILSQSQSQSSCSSRSSLIFKSEKTRFTQSPKMTSVTSNSSFKARPLPASNAQPNSSPRMSKAAMLRLGLPWTPPTRSVSPSGTPESETSRVIPSVASLNPPSVAPRATKASTLRADGTLPVDSQPRVKKTESEIFENTPGHSFRRRSLVIPSIATPKTAPRPNRSSALRAGELMTGNPRQKREKVNEKAIFNNTPGHKRNEKIEVRSNRRPEVEVRPTRSSTLRALSDSSNGSQVNLSKSGMSKSQRSQAAIDKRTSFDGGE
ncbi:hypothetical protein DFH28DRAFT_951859 [Melampsora americana]|nr:hypothetical protein DFH28DRAFT_951859 [Melampsora americana]